MRVVVSPEIFGLQTIGGISRYFVELHAALVRQGVDARIHAGRHINTLLRSTDGVSGRYKGGVRLRRLERRWNESVFRVWCGLHSHGLVVHRSYYDFSCRPRCARLITTVHDLIPELFSDIRQRPDSESIRKRMACEQADAVCVNSLTTANDLMRLWQVPRERIWVTLLGVRAVSPSSLDWCGSHGAYVLYVGQRSGYKNAERLFEAFAASGLAGRIRLLCFGGGPFTHKEYAGLQKLRIDDRVLHVYGDDHDLAACYKSALGYICPSRYEGFGLPVLEAMAHGCPVACARAGALPEVAGSSAIYFDPVETGSVVTALQALADGPLAHKPLVSAGLAHAARFTWAKTAEATIAAYLGARPSELPT